MASIKSWVSALRPRTLFLAVATTLCGSGLAYSTGHFSSLTCILTMLTAILLQLLSNLANDLGDFQHGTDITGERLGPTRTVQSGAISPQEMKKGIAMTIILSILVGTFLVYEVLKFLNPIYMIIFLVLGAASILAAIKYTAGKNPYGYKGLGDLFSFIFFGLVSVVGTYFLHVHLITSQPWLPAIGMGLFTAAVLNINNMRDIDNDRNSGKITLAARLGISKAKHYHTMIVVLGVSCFLSYSIIYSVKWYQFAYLFFFIPFFIILYKIYKTKENRQLDPYLKYTSMATFILSIAFIICINL